MTVSEMAKPRRRRRVAAAGAVPYAPRAPRWRRWVFAGFAVYIGAILAVQEANLWKIRHERAAVIRRLNAAHARNHELWRQVRVMRSDAYVEKAAREELGLTRPGEILYLPDSPAE